MTDAATAKRAIRDRVRASRIARGDAGAAALGAAFAEQQVALATEVGASSVATYLSMPEEPDTRGFLDWALANGVRVLLPIVRSDGLLDWAEHDGTETVGAFGLAEPDTERLPPTALCDVDLILVPAAAVDREGARLGWGRGFFDKALATLQRRPPVFAVTFDDEVVDHVPSEPHDVPVDGVLTERGRHESMRS